MTVTTGRPGRGERRDGGEGPGGEEPPAVAVKIAELLLRHAAEALPKGTSQGTFRIDWAGPVDTELPDERAVQAACGLQHVHGRATGGPVPLAVDYASVVAGVLAALGATAVGVGRARGLRLREARTSVAQGALLAISQYLAAATAREGGEVEPPVPEVGDSGGYLGLATLVSLDGHRFEIETLDPEAWREFWVRLAVPAALSGRGWLPFQQRFATAVCPLPEVLRQAARRHALAELREAAYDTGVSLLVVSSDPLSTVNPAPWRLTPGPGQGQDTATGVEPWGFGSPAARPPGEPLLPLAGLRVVESTRRVQGPLAGHVLGMLGAEVVRIEPPGGDPMRWLPPLAGDCSARFLALNAGKRVVEADLTTARGRAAARELACDADVFLHNWAPGKAARHGLDAADLLPARPALVHAWASGFGDTFGDRPTPVGTDYLAQVYTGLAAAVRPAGEPPAPSLMTLTDVLGGLVSAQAVVTALARRAATGRGSGVESSLVSAGALIPRPAGRVEWATLDRPLPTADGHLSLGPRARRNPEAVRRVLAGGGDTRSRTTEDWRERLAGAGLTATPVLTDLAGLARDPAFKAAVAPPDPAAPYARPHSPWTFA
ncbi:CoA transferase [Streptomyces sp. NPDC048717]|uniref:CoA transferase n=1 Tax=Streptomyces sp. NPDC048717 TaxID=3154928 RepID=UPI00342CB2D0